MRVKIILDDYPPYLKPDKLYEIEGQSQIDPNIYFILTDDGSTTSVHLSELLFLQNLREEKINEILDVSNT